jgi:hypothetical protein
MATEKPEVVLPQEWHELQSNSNGNSYAFEVAEFNGHNSDAVRLTDEPERVTVTEKSGVVLS